MARGIYEADCAAEVLLHESLDLAQAALAAHDAWLEARGWMVVQGWQPIESALRDGSKCDVWANGKRYADAIWADWLDCFAWWDATAEWNEGAFVRLTSATHWMPLPASPLAGGE